MPDLDEPEILQGMRGWADAQRLLVGVPDPAWPPRVVQACWYGNDLDDHEGAFCMVGAGAGLDDLVGDVVRVGYGDLSVGAYCVGSVSLPTEVALARTAFLRLAALSETQVTVTVQRLLRSAA